jgi:iduronate 2-sulfatase
MWRLLSNPDQSFKQAAFSQFHRQDGSVPLMGYAMRTQRYRYVEWQDRRTREVVTAELYDHDSDSEENNNIAGQPDNRALLADLSRQMWTALPQPPEYVARNPVPIAARPSEE